MTANERPTGRAPGPFIPPPADPTTMDWGELFDRADGYDVTVPAVREALATRREGTDQ